MERQDRQQPRVAGTGAGKPDRPWLEDRQIAEKLFHTAILGAGAPRLVKSGHWDLRIAPWETSRDGPLRRGWTTGACAAAAAKAAFEALLTGDFPDPVEILLPKGDAAELCPGPPRP